MNSVISWRFVPVRTRTPAAFPAAIAASGGCGNTTPSTTGWNGKTLTPSSRNAGIAAITSSVDFASAAPTSAAFTPSCSMTRAATSVARCRRRRPRRRAALRDRPREQPARGRRAEQHADTRAPRRFAEHGDALRVAAERADAVAHPLERGNLVEHAEISRARVLRAEQLGEVQVAEKTEAIVDRDHHDVAAGREVRAVVPRRVARAPYERAAVDPHYDGTRGIVAAGRPDVEVETVLAARRC